MLLAQVSGFLPSFFCPSSASPSSSDEEEYVKLSLPSFQSSQPSAGQLSAQGQVFLPSLSSSSVACWSFPCQLGYLTATQASHQATPVIASHSHAFPSLSTFLLCCHGSLHAFCKISSSAPSSLQVPSLPCLSFSQPKKAFSQRWLSSPKLLASLLAMPGSQVMAQAAA